jgi:hypothetical protein
MKKAIVSGKILRKFCQYAEGMAQVVECLLKQAQGPEFKPQFHQKKKKPFKSELKLLKFLNS